MGRGTRRGGVRRDRTQWQRLIAKQAESGLSQRGFCERHGLAYGSFCGWKRRLREEVAPEDAASEFVEVALGPGSSPAWDVELTLGEGMVLRIGRR